MVPGLPRQKPASSWMNEMTTLSVCASVNMPCVVALKHVHLIRSSACLCLRAAISNVRQLSRKHQDLMKVHNKGRLRKPVYLDMSIQRA